MAYQDAWLLAAQKKKPQATSCLGLFNMEADVGIEPAYTDLQSAA